MKNGRQKNDEKHTKYYMTVALISFFLIVLHRNMKIYRAEIGVSVFSKILRI